MITASPSERTSTMKFSSPLRSDQAAPRVSVNGFAGLSLGQLRAIGYPPAGDPHYTPYCRALDLAWGAQKALEAAGVHNRQLLGLEPPEPGTWRGHLVCLYRMFGDRAFLVAYVCERGQGDPDFVLPPHFPGSLARRDAPVRLGKLYAARDGQDKGDGAVIARAYKSGNVRRWTVAISA